jgi:hypothetical protein
MINRLLTELSKVIEDDPSHGFVDMLDEDTLPQNGAVFVRAELRFGLASQVSGAGLAHYSLGL